MITKRILALTLALSLLLSSCGGSSTEAATMKLARTEGTVGVSDGDGKEVPPAENLGLYSGYQVATQSVSYAWVNLDDVKLTKMDQDSEIMITKEGKRLEIEVRQGSLFFNVTEPLASDETLEIRTSTMMVGIRGTCGWVTQDTAALLEGAMEVTAGEQAVTITAGEMAFLSREGEIQTRSFTDQEVPGFVLAEIREPLPKELLEGSQDTGSLTDLLAERDKHSPIRITYYGADGTPFERSEFTLDEEGRILHGEHRSLVELADDSIWATYSDYIYDDQGYWLETWEYDGTGNLIGKNILLENTAERQEVKHVFDRSIYNAEGDIVETVTDTSRGVGLYGEDGRLIRWEEYNQDGVLYSYELFEYDERGRIIQENIYMTDGSLMGYNVYEYKD